MTESCARRAEAFRISSFGFPSAFLIQISSFDLAFHIPNRREPRHRLADSRQLSRCDYFIDVFISWAGFLGQTCPRCTPNVNAARFEIALELFAVPLFARLGAAHGAAAPVRRAEESFRARRCAHEQIRAGLHAAADDHRLAYLSVTRGHFLVSWPERARRAFAVHEQILFFSIDNMPLQLRSVV